MIKAASPLEGSSAHRTWGESCSEKQSRLSGRIDSITVSLPYMHLIIVSPTLAFMKHLQILLYSPKLPNPEEILRRF